MKHVMPVVNYVVVCGIFLNFDLLLCQQCTVRTLRVDPDKTESRHQGYTFISFEQIGPNTCFDECIRRPRCLSFNYNRINRHCEINEGNRETDVVEGSHYVYVNIEQYKKVRINIFVCIACFLSTYLTYIEDKLSMDRICSKICNPYQMRSTKCRTWSI